MTGKTRVLFAAFLASGFCGLIYQSIWSHYLKLFLGHAAYAQTVVLMVFIGGMAAGAWAVGQRSAKLRNPLLVYAAAEALIGLFALGFHDLYEALTHFAYAQVLPTWCGGDGPCAAQTLLAVALILPPSVLLGTTFPLMSAGVLRLLPDAPGSKIALLYFLNSLGAVGGVLCSGFVLIPAVGLPGTQLAAGLGNLLIGLLVYLTARGTSGHSLHVEPADDIPLQAHAVRRETRALLMIAGLTGLSSFIYEIVWVRMLSMVLGASTQAFEVMLASFILGLAIGGFVVHRRIDRQGGTLRQLAVVQLAMGVLAMATLAVYDQSFAVNGWILQALSRNPQGFALYAVTSTAIAMAVMLPATICAGMTLPLITYRLLRLRAGERAIGLTYGVNTLGGIGGVALAVHLLLPLLGLKTALITGGAIDIGLGAVLLFGFCPRDQHRPQRWMALAALAAIPLAALTLQLDPRKAASSVFRGGASILSAGAEVIYARDGKTATVHVVRHPGNQVQISTNGKSDGAANLDLAHGTPRRDEWTMTLIGALPMLHHPQAQQVALIGFGTGMSTATVLDIPTVKSVETIEIEPAMVEGARVFAPLVGAAFTDPRSHVIIDDAKSHFARGLKRYDAILAEPSNPWVSGVASLFTQEFYRQTHRHIAKDGLFLQWISTYEMDVKVVASILGALRQSFPRFEVYETTPDNLLILARADPQLPLRLDASLLQGTALRTRLAKLGITDIEHLQLRRIGSQATLDPLIDALAVPANSDYFPYVDLHAPEARFVGASARSLTDVALAPVPVLEMLDGSAPPAGKVLRGATPRASAEGPRAAALDALAALGLGGTATPSAAELAALNPALREAVQWTQLGLLQCPPPPGLGDHAPLVSAALTLARAVNPHAPPRLVQALWQQVLAQPCHVARSPQLKAWLDLHAAVANRDAKAMARQGRLLLTADPGAPPDAVELALAAALLGDQALGQRAQAQALWRVHGARLPLERQQSSLFLVLGRGD